MLSYVNTMSAGPAHTSGAEQEGGRSVADGGVMADLPPVRKIEKPEGQLADVAALRSARETAGEHKFIAKEYVEDSSYLENPAGHNKVLVIHGIPLS